MTNNNDDPTFGEDPFDERDYEITTLEGLVRGVSNQKTGGYEVSFDIKPNLKKARAGDGFFLIVEVQDNDPNTQLNGEWWFWDDNTVMQVL